MESSFIDFLTGVLVISLSGALAPGPLTAVTVGEGSSNPHAGALAAVGHGVVEFPLMIAVYLGFGRIIGLPYVKPVISILGGAFLLFMAAEMFRGMISGGSAVQKGSRTPLAAGILLTAGNPYFLIWWATVGAALVVRATAYGVVGMGALMLGHWSIDLAWLWFLSALSFRGGTFFGRSFQRIVCAVTGAALAVFGGMFIYDAVRMLT